MQVPDAVSVSDNESAGSLLTRWSMVQGAVVGDRGAKDRFVETYADTVHRFFVRRWRGTALFDELDDAVQEVFVDCLGDRGALKRFRRHDRDGVVRRFRSFLFGVARTVALRVEERRRRERARLEDGGGASRLDALAGDEPTMSRAFDRAWAEAVLRRAAARLHAEARDAGRSHRVVILELRFRDGLPVREIATRLGEDAARVHHQYAEARKDFERCLRAELADCGWSGPRACAELMAMLGP